MGYCFYTQGYWITRYQFLFIYRLKKIKRQRPCHHTGEISAYIISTDKSNLSSRYAMAGFLRPSLVTHLP